MNWPRLYRGQCGSWQARDCLLSLLLLRTIPRKMASNYESVSIFSPHHEGSRGGWQLGQQLAAAACGLAMIIQFWMEISICKVEVFLKREGGL